MDIPGDLMVEILSRLPIKSLMRCKCVSKTCQTLILSPLFVTIHFNRNKNRNIVSHLLHSRDFNARKNHIYSFVNDDAATYMLHLPFPCSRVHKAIVGSCNGLVCIQLSACSRFGELPFFVAWNPATRQFRHLPRLPNMADPASPRRSLRIGSFSGFDFLPTIGDYKLATIIFFRGKLREIITRVVMFTWSSNSWREIKNAVLPCKISEYDHVLVNGSLYWTGIEFGNPNRIDLQQLVVCFDMNEEKFRQIMVPSSPDYNSSPGRSLAVFKGSLAMFVFTLEDNWFDVWVMRSNKESWSKQFTIGHSVMNDYIASRYCVPQGFWLNNEVIVFAIWGKSGKELWLYDPHTNEAKNFPSHEGEHVCDFFPYVETLVSPLAG